MHKITRFCFCLFILSILNSYSQNLITNGDFGVFNPSILKPVLLGYQTSYNQIAYNAGASFPRQYSITNNSTSVDPANFKKVFDHTSGNGEGNMMLVDGKNNEIFWKQDPNLQLQAGLTYVFSYWVVDVNRNTTAQVPAPKIKFNPSGCSNCTSQIVDVATLPAGWNKVTYSITPTTTQWIRIELSTVNAADGGNNFAIDDVSLIPPTPLLTISNSKSNPSCPNATDGTIVVYPNGGVPPYSFALTGNSTDTNFTGVFQNLGAGSYIVSVTDSNSPPSTISTQNISMEPPLDIVLTSVPSTCILSGSPLTLTATNGGNVYQWSASTGISILDTDNKVIVAPTENTTYTVSSTITSSVINQNLIGNGDFESGTSGFFSDYGYSTSNTSGAQFAYGVVDNPKSWFTDFIVSKDHSGIGKMLVADGATTPNKVIWSQSLPVEINHLYTFSFWAQNLVANSPAQFQVLINGTAIIVSPISATNGATSGWTQVIGTWNSNSETIATIKIIDSNIIASGNDFALDDISFSTPTSKTCNLTTQLTVNVGGTIPVTSFSYTTPICKGGSNPLPIVATGFTSGGIYSESTALLSINPSTGEINLAASTSGTYTVKYLVAENLNICQKEGVSTFEITIGSTAITPEVVSPVNYCKDYPSVALEATALPNATLNWYGTNSVGGNATSIAPIPSTTLIGSTSYYVSQSIGACESLRKEIIVIVSPPALPSFGSIPSSICQNAITTPLPTTSTNNITGTWLPPINNLVTTNYTFTPDLGQCATTAAVTINVKPIIIPSFNTIAPICSGGILLALPLTSINGIIGAWSPQVNNTSTTTYTFTPNLGQCATNQTMEVIVNLNITPTFNPVSSICSGGTLSPLPTKSLNNISGTWSPILDNTNTTTYTFLPDSGQCSLSQTLIITVNPLPEFSITSECNGKNFVLEIKDGNTDFDYSWHDSSEKEIGNTSSIIVTQKGNYSVDVSSKGSLCKSTKQIVVNSVFCDIPRGISPNGDTKNDSFDLSNYSVNKLEIFNRYGLKVYSKENYKKEWTGTTDSGQELPDGTYYYVVELTSGDSKTGWVYINR